MVMLIKNVDLGGRNLDVSVKNGLIAEIGEGLAMVDALSVYDGQGGALLPGLHDHHIHLNAAAAAMSSVSCGPPDIKTKAQLIEVLHSADADFIRGIGYHYSVAGRIDRQWLDAHGPQKPIRIQHRTGRLWILNSLAMQKLEISKPENGRLMDADKAMRAKSSFPDLQPLINRLLSYGITGVTEVTPHNGLSELENYRRQTGPLSLSIMGSAELKSHQSQHLKLHYHDYNLPPLETLVSEMQQAHEAGRNIASHCVTRAELMLTLAAIEMAGSIYGDRIEHAAIADDAAIEWMQNLGVIVVTQPNFITERKAAYLVDVPKSEHPNLWRLRAFTEAGLRVAAGSDAPFGNPNPWAAMAAAVTRPSGFEDEAISPEVALALYTKPAADAGANPRNISVGGKADMCLLDRDWDLARAALADVQVRATWIAGELVYNRVD